MSNYKEIDSLFKIAKVYKDIHISVDSYYDLLREDLILDFDSVIPGCRGKILEANIYVSNFMPTSTGYVRIGIVDNPNSKLNSDWSCNMVLENLDIDKVEKILKLKAYW